VLPAVPPAWPASTVTCSDVGWQIQPAALRGLIPEVGRRYKLPLYITENGIADARDRKRGKYIHDHVAAVRSVEV